MVRESDKIKTNYIFNIFYQLLAVVLPLITAPYISRKLGVVNVGYYSNVASMVSYFTLIANLGIYTYGRREIGSLQKSREDYTKAFWGIFGVKLLIGTMVLVAYGIFIAVYQQFKTLFYIQTFTILSQILDISWFYQGLENYKITVTYQTIVKVSGVIAIFILIQGPDDLSKYAFIMAFLSFLGTISVFPLLKKYVSRPFLDIHSMINHIKGAILLFIPQIATSLYMSIDKTMIGYFHKDGVQNGLYEQATKIDIIGLYIVIALTGVMIPRLSLYYKENNYKELNKAASLAIGYIMFIGCPLAFGISGVGYNILPWFLGPGYEGASSILQITAFIIIVMGITNFLGYGYMIATRQQKLYSITVFVGLTVNVFLNVLLIPEYGGLGAAIASLVSETIVLIFQLYFVSRQIDLRNAFGGTIKYMILGMVMGVIVLFLSRSLTAKPIVSFFICLVGMSLYIAPLLLLKDVNAVKAMGGMRELYHRVKTKRW